MIKTQGITRYQYKFYAVLAYLWYCFHSQHIVLVAQYHVSSEVLEYL